MLGKINDFAFIMNENHFKQLEDVYNFDFAEHKRLNAPSVYQDVNAYKHTLSLKGLLVQRPMQTLEPLIELAKTKQPARFTTLKHDFFVIIKSIRRGADKFNKDGSFMVQSFDISLEELIVWDIYTQLKTATGLTV